MISQHDLTLRLTRLKSGEVWSQKSEGLHFFLLRQGEAVYTSGSVTRNLGAGDLLLLGETAEGSVGTLNGKDVEFWSFSLHLDHLFPLFGSAEIPLLHQIVERLKSLRVYSATTDVAVECHNLASQVSAMTNLSQRCQVLRIAAAVLNDEFQNAEQNACGFDRMDEHLAQVFEHLSLDELLHLPVGGLAKKFNCSRRHLNRIFHQYFGFSVAALRMEMRLLKAVSLLRDPAAKVSNVAQECGFNHSGLFNLCFKKRFGDTPGNWRRAATAPAKAQSLSVEEVSTCRRRVIGLCPWSEESARLAPQLPLAPPPPKPASGRNGAKQMPPAVEGAEKFATTERPKWLSKKQGKTSLQML